ncbi:hypothetical protein AVEN_89828-1 [Araneus ventricosus]|uniref:FERM central domain-containing protein n=1 Tax=Araneus ventricosus TaxID=182803 RepID=A0A4Y2RUY6_ARAVE|nr:hypothetical protein AVEN_89828-1 [Araneus ventricosus]
MSERTFNYILSNICSAIQKRDTHFRLCIPPKEMRHQIYKPLFCIKQLGHNTLEENVGPTRKGRRLLSDKNCPDNDIGYDKTAGGKAHRVYLCILSAPMSDSDNRVRFIGIVSVSEKALARWQNNDIGLFCLQLQRLVVSGDLPCSKEEAALLAGIQLRIEETWPSAGRDADQRLKLRPITEDAKVSRLVTWGGSIPNQRESSTPVYILAGCTL